MQFTVIEADPPWTFHVRSKKGAGRTAAHHYDVMNNADILALGESIRPICAADCALFLWATYPNLDFCIEVGKHWGFTFKTVAFTWIKTNKKSPSYFTGLGYWTRANPEIVLLFTKGKPKRVHKGISNLLVAPVSSHSKKPDLVYQKIERLMGDVTRIRLFARDQRAGWISVGNELSGQDIQLDLTLISNDQFNQEGMNNEQGSNTHERTARQATDTAEF